MQKSMIMFTFSVLDRKYHFLANLVQKFKTISLIWNLVPRLLQIVKFNGDVQFFGFRLFLASFVQKIHFAFWVTWLISQQSTHRDLKSVVFLFFFSFVKLLKIIVKESPIYINFIAFKVIVNLNHTLVYHLNLIKFIEEHGQTCEKENISVKLNFAHCYEQGHLTLLAPISQNGQTQANNSSANKTSLLIMIAQNLMSTFFLV